MSPSFLLSAFSESFGRAASVVARAPGRVNLIGEHTDYNDGLVLPIALEHSTWVAVAARSDGIVRARSREQGETREWTLHRWRESNSPHWTAYIGGVAALLRERGAYLDGCDVFVASDVPVGAGVSSSAALTVAVLKALISLSGEAMDANEVVDLARRVEHEFAGVPCGIMDMSASLLSHPDTALLLDCRERSWQHIPVRLGERRIAVIGTGVEHSLADGEYAKRQKQCADAVAYFQRVTPQVHSLRDVDVAMVRRHALQMDPVAAARALHVSSEIARVSRAAEALRKDDFATLGPLMYESHRSLRDDYEVSCRELDRLVAIAAKTPGVIGARMTGGGFGGSIVAIVEASATESLEAAVRAGYDGAGFGVSTFLYTRPGAGASVEVG